MAIRTIRPVSLSFDRLETRDVPAASLPGGDPLQIDSASYQAERVIVSAPSGTPPVSPLIARYESLGANLYSAELRNTTTVAQALSFFQGRREIAFAQPDYRVFITATPNDASYSTQWALNNTGQSGGTSGADIGAAAAWNFNTGSGNTVVAVIDTGVDSNHPDLAANMWKNSREVAGNGRDDDGNGYVDDSFGYDFANNDANPFDDNGHGTHVAGIIGATGNNGTGISGVNWKVKIMALKFLDSNGSGYLSDAVKAVNYAVANGAKIINNSYGGGGYDAAMNAAIANARTRGVIFVAAAGNDGSNNDAVAAYPANYNSDNIVSVAATDRNDNLASFSNFGRTSVDIAAPGVAILSTLPGNRYGNYSGTSMATPYVAGAMALVWDAHPTWTYKQVIDAVLNTADKVSSLTGKVATGGRLDVGKAIQYGTTTPTPTPTDKTGAVINSVVFSGSGTAISRARVAFTEAVNASTFTAADVRLTGPAGQVIAITGVTVVAGSNSTQFDVTFASQSAVGTYRIAIGPAISDVAGNALNQNGNAVNGETTDAFNGTHTIVAAPTGSTKTHASTNVGQTIGDFGKVVSTVVVTDDVTVRDLNLQLNITHSYVGDLRITLVAPDGTRQIIALRRGGSGNNYANTILDDEASTGLWQGAAPFTGTYRPDNVLSVFDGKSAKGTWQLIVEDTSLFDTGKLNGWSLIVDGAARATAVSSPVVKATMATAIDPTGLAVAIRNLLRNRRV
jgi:serine protease